MVPVKSGMAATFFNSSRTEGMLRLVTAGPWWRAMAQKDPLVEYQREGFDLFTVLVDAVKEDTLRYMYHVKVVQQEAPQRPTAVQTSGPTAKRRTVRVKGKIGRNEPCPCGSGKKYKMCHGKPGAEPLAG